MHVPANWVIIGSGNGLSLIQQQGITWPNALLLSIGRVTQQNWNKIKSLLSFREYAFESIMDKMSAVCFSLQWRHYGRDGVSNRRRLDG